MKKILTLLALLSFAVGGLMAQVVDAPVKVSNFHLLWRCITDNNNCAFYSDDVDDRRGGTVIIYNENLERIKEVNLPDDVLWVDYVSNEIPADPEFFKLSSSVFNTDDKFEYIVPVVSVVGHDDEGRPIEQTTGFMLKNEEGELLQTVNFPDNLCRNNYDFVPKFYDLGDVKYLKIEELRNNLDSYDYYELMYRIDGGVSAVLSLACPPMRVQARPTVAEASEPVTVSFDSDNVSRIEVVSVKGSIAGAFDVVPGEHTATIDTSRLGKGMYIINVVENGSRSENCKIIIR